MKSSQHQPSLKYLRKPYPTHFKIISAAKITVKISSPYPSIFFKSGFSFINLSSNAY